MRRVLCMTVGLCLWASIVQSQVLGTGVTPVVEVGAQLTQNTISAIQNTITAAQSVLIQANQIIDLTPVRSLTAADGIMEDIQLLCSIVAEATAIQTDVASVELQMQALLNLDTAPSTRPALDQRMAELRQLKTQAQSFAMRTQTLIRTVLRTGDHIRALLSDVEKLIGNLSGIQRTAELQTVQNKTMVVLAAQTAAWQRTDTLDRMSDALVVESISRIERSRLDGWPRW